MPDNIYTSGQYYETNPDYHIEDSPLKAAEILSIIQKNELHPNTICEIGCGAGEILRLLQAQLPESIQFHGYDISPDAIDLCKERENGSLTCHLDDLLAVDTDMFDLMLCIDVFEHVEDYLSFLRKLRKKAKYTVFRIPLDLSLQTLFRSDVIMYARTTVGHLHYFWKDSAIASLTDTGYKIIDWSYAHNSINKPDKSLSSRLAYLPRRLLTSINADLSVRILGGTSLIVLAENTH